MMKKVHKRLLNLSVVVLIGSILALCNYLSKTNQENITISGTHLNEIWVHKSSKAILSSPVIVGDILVYGTFDGKLVAISIETGASVWTKTFNGPIFSLTKDGRGHIYIGTGLHTDQKSTIAAVNAADGQIIWQGELTGHLEEPPTIDEQRHTLWVGAGPGSLWALDTRDGTMLWHKDLGHLDATPLLHDDILYVPAQVSETVHKSYFYALNAQTGDILWKLEQKGQPWASPDLHKEGHIILTNTAEGQIGLHLSTDKGWAYGLSTDGKVIWERELPDMALTPNFYFPENDFVTYVTKDGSLITLNAMTGDSIWQQKFAEGFGNEGALLTGFKEYVIAVLSEKGQLFLIDAENGDVLSSKKMDNDYGSAPVWDGKRLFVPTAHEITALEIVK